MRKSARIFQVTVYRADGDYFTEYTTALSDTDATEKARRLYPVPMAITVDEMPTLGAL